MLAFYLVAGFVVAPPVLFAALVPAATCGYANASTVNPPNGNAPHNFGLYWRTSDAERATLSGNNGYKIVLPPSFLRSAAEFDVAPYTSIAASDYTLVTLPSRDGNELSAWWAGGYGTGAPAVVLVHGWNACKQHPNVLMPANMLYRRGVNVLLLDLRNQGASAAVANTAAGESEPSVLTMGITEYNDVLGAWDWLRAAGWAEGSIGLFGVSLGGASVLKAMGQEPRVAAAWLDSTLCDLPEGLSRVQFGSVAAAFLIAPAFGPLNGRVAFDISAGQHPTASAKLIRSSQAVHFVTTTGDLTTGERPTDQCFDLVAAASASPQVTKTIYDDRSEHATHIAEGDYTSATSNGFNSHAMAYIYYSAPYERELGAFFCTKLSGSCQAER